MIVRDETFAAYFNARIRGMKSQLLTRSQLEELLDAGDVQTTINTLMDSPYKEELAEALSHAHGADAVEEAASRNLVNTFRKLLHISGAFEGLAAIFLARWDLMAVKSLLRVRHHGLDATTGLQALIPGPSLTVALVQELAQRDTMESLVAGLVGWSPALASVLAKALPQYHESRDVSVLEDALDRHYFVDNVRALEEQPGDDAAYLRQYLRMEIDRINLRAIFQMRSQLALEDRSTHRLLPEGTLSMSFLQQLLDAGSDEDAIALMMRTPYSEIEEALFQYTQRRMFAPLERLLELAMLAKLKRGAVKEVLSIAVLMHYAWLKYNEAVNLRLIARGQARHLPSGRVREEVLFA